MQVAKIARSGNQLRQCEERYAFARLDPFDKRAGGSCIPGQSNVPSLTQRTFSKGVISSTASNGLVIGVSPNASSDSPSLRWKVGTDTTTLATLATAPNSIIADGAFFPDSSFSSGNLEQRLVGWGLRIWTLDAALTKSQYIGGYSGPDADAVLDTAGTMGQWTSELNGRIMPKGKAGDTPMQILFRSDNMVDTEKWRNTSMWMGNVAGSESYQAVIFVAPNDDTGVSTSIYYEFVAHWELRGSTVAAQQKAHPESQPGAGAKLHTLASNLLGQGAQLESALFSANHIVKMATETLQTGVAAAYTVNQALHAASHLAGRRPAARIEL